MATDVVLDFGPGRYRFHLPMKRILEVERECGGKSIATMYVEMSENIGIERDGEKAVFVVQGNVKLLDVYHVIRCAAIGGGEREDAEGVKAVSAIDAKTLVDEYVADAPFSETVPVAWSILDAVMHGVRLKKKADPEPESGPDPSIAE